MDAVEFIVTRDRMCKSFNNRCSGCEIANRMDGNESCNDYIKRYPAEAVAIVEKWSKEHPRKTRQNEFLKLFPKGRLASDGMLKFCLQEVDSGGTQYVDTGVVPNNKGGVHYIDKNRIEAAVKTLRRRTERGEERN